MFDILVSAFVSYFRFWLPTLCFRLLIFTLSFLSLVALTKISPN